MSNSVAPTQREIDFINWKIESDSMWQMDLMAPRASIDTGETFYANRDWLFLSTNRSDIVFNNMFSDTAGIPFANVQVDSIAIENRKSQWSRNDIYPLQKVRRRPPKDGKGIYYMSNPIFSEDGRMVILYVSIIWAPLFGRGYVELYELQEDGTWKMTAQHNTWMS